MLKVLTLFLLTLFFNVSLVTAEEPEPTAANRDYQITFPKDHGAHPGMNIEWWYYTGNLREKGGGSSPREFGYQLTFFRLKREANENPSPWNFNQFYFAHFAVSDITNKRFSSAERYGRGSMGRAGASTNELNVWIGDWRALGQKDSAGRDYHLLEASTSGRGENDIAISLKAIEGEVLFHGENGYSQKSPNPDNASHYYSFPRMQTEGTLYLADKRIEVSGYSWMDHEFGSSFLEKGQQGWDWFSLRLEDGTNLMLFRIRSEAEVGEFKRGTIQYLGNDGQLKTESLTESDFNLEEVGHYTSEKSGARYPISWKVKLPKKGIDLAVEARFPEQELKTKTILGNAQPTYWEGSIAATGSHQGEGYLEMTGYSGASMDRFLAEQSE